MISCIATYTHRLSSRIRDLDIHTSPFSNPRRFCDRNLEELVEDLVDVSTVVETIVDVPSDMALETELDLRVVVIKSVDMGESMPDEDEAGDLKEVVDEMTISFVDDTEAVGAPDPSSLEAIRCRCRY